MEYIPLDREKKETNEFFNQEITKCESQYVNTQNLNIYKLDRISNEYVPDKSRIKTVKTVKNDYTKKFNFNNASDIIQSSLEYNEHLIRSIIENKNNLNSDELALCMNILSKNLTALASNVGETISLTNSLLKSNKYCELYSDFKKRTKYKKKSEESGLTIIVDKRILENTNNLS